MDWSNIDLGYFELPLIFIWWVTGSLWLGFGGVFFVAACRFLQQYSSRIVTYVAIPFIWIVGEMFGSLVFSVMTFGPGGSITTALSFGYLGYLLAEHNVLIQVAQVTGVYSLGVLFVSLATMIYVCVINPTYKKYGLVLFAFVMMTSFFPLPEENSDGDSYTVAVIDTHFDLSDLRTQVGRDEIKVQLETAVQAALQLKPDYILLPEDAQYFNQQNTPNLEASQFSFRTQHSDVIIVDSGRADDSDRAVVQSFVYNGKEGVVDQSHKRYLVPQGEFMPSLYVAGLKLFGRDEVIDQFAQTVAFTVGSNPSQKNHAATSPGVLFCFESVSPWGVRTILSERGEVPFIAHPVSHAWFNQPYTLWSQLTNMLRVQAIWNQEYIITAGNKFKGYAITPKGNIIYLQEMTGESDWLVGVVAIPK